MKTILIIVSFMALVAVLSAQRWRSKTTKYVLIAIIALLQTALVILDMFTMKVPKL